MSMGVLMDVRESVIAAEVRRADDMLLNVVRTTPTPPFNSQIERVEGLSDTFTLMEPCNSIAAEADLAGGWIQVAKRSPANGKLPPSGAPSHGLKATHGLALAPPDPS